MMKLRTHLPAAPSRGELVSEAYFARFGEASDKRAARRTRQLRTRPPQYTVVLSRRVGSYRGFGSSAKEALEAARTELRIVRATGALPREPFAVRHPHVLLGPAVVAHRLRWSSQPRARRRATVPILPAPHVGVEIEVRLMDASRETLEEIIALDRGLRHWVNVGTDGSIRHEGARDTAEIRVCAPRAHLGPILKHLFEVARPVGLAVDTSCGLHVHLDQRGSAPEERTGMYSRLVRALPLLISMVPASRRDNPFCMKNTPSRSFPSSRYHAINPSTGKDTVEVRLHSGSTSAEKIVRWVAVLASIAYASDEAFGARVPRTLDGWSDRLAWGWALEGWVATRLRKFSPSSPLLPERSPRISVADVREDSEAF